MLTFSIYCLYGLFSSYMESGLKINLNYFFYSDSNVYFPIIICLITTLLCNVRLLLNNVIVASIPILWVFLTGFLPAYQNHARPDSCTDHYVQYEAVNAQGRALSPIHTKTTWNRMLLCCNLRADVCAVKCLEIYNYIYWSIVPTLGA